MSTFSQLKTEIANKLGEGTLSSTFIGDEINSVIRYYGRSRFWFNEDATSITLTANDPVVPSLPSDFLYEIPDGGLVISYSSNRYVLTKKGNAEYDIENCQGIGLPYMYRNRDSQLELYYYPDQAYTLLLYYVKKYSDLSADGDTNGFTDNADQLIVYATLSRLYETYRKDSEKGLYYRSIADDELNRLLIESNRRTSTGSLVIEDLSQSVDSTIIL